MCDPLPCLVFFGLVSFTSIPFLYIAIICGRSRGNLDYFRHQRCKLSTFLSIISIFAYKSLIIAKKFKVWSESFGVYCILSKVCASETFSSIICVLSANLTQHSLTVFNASAYGSDSSSE